MALAVTHIAAADLSDTTGGDPITIPSFSMVSGRLYTFAITSASATDRTITSITLPGSGTVVVLAEVWRTTDFGLHIGYCLCTGDGTGTGSIDFSGATTGCNISIDEWTGHDPGDPVVDTNVAESTGTGAVAPIPMSFDLPNALANASNAIWGAFGVDNVAINAPGADFTETFDAGHSSPTRRLQTLYDVSPVDLTVDATNNGAAVGWAGAAFEVRAEDTSEPAPAPGYRRIYGPAVMGTSPAALYTVPTNRLTRVRALAASNPTAGAIELILEQEDGAYFAETIPAGARIRRRRPAEAVLAEGEALSGSASASGLVVVIDAYEEAV